MSSITAVSTRTCASAPKNVSGWVGRTACPCCGRCWHPVSYGLALIREGKPAEGIAPLKAGIAFWEATGGKVRSPTMKAFLAEAMALTGDLDNALQLIDEADRPNRTPRVGGTPLLRRDPAPQGLDALAQGRP